MKWIRKDRLSVNMTGKTIERKDEEREKKKIKKLEVKNVDEMMITLMLIHQV